jgi:hypothetical protein
MTLRACFKQDRLPNLFNHFSLIEPEVAINFLVLSQSQSIPLRQHIEAVLVLKAVRLFSLHIWT